ncbi:MAG: hypothetical protein BWY66_00135 [bacterium ADurb.Bin374]|nr:MAG: hypothetical protein BWY66_00135 [bacterium ADurb.Bin374]
MRTLRVHTGPGEDHPHTRCMCLFHEEYTRMSHCRPVRVIRSLRPFSSCLRPAETAFRRAGGLRVRPAPEAGRGEGWSSHPSRVRYPADSERMRRIVRPFQRPEPGRDHRCLLHRRAGRMPGPQATLRVCASACLPPDGIFSVFSIGILATKHETPSWTGIHGLSRKIFRSP